MFYSNPTGCTIFFFLEKFLALHVSDITCVHRRDHNCSVPMAVHYSCAPDDGCMWRQKHVELETFQEKRVLYIQLDSNKTYGIFTSEKGCKNNDRSRFEMFLQRVI
jgi:hypothetical protein